MAFVELHARSAFSFLRGSSSPEELTTRAAALGMEQLAVCDRDGVYGSARVHHKAMELGIRGIVGSELTLEDGSVLPVLVKTRQGYQNLCRLLTRAKLRAAKGQSRVLWDELPEFSTGLIALTGDEEGPLQRALANRQPSAAIQVLERLTHAFSKDHLAVEMQRHRLRGDQRNTSSLKELAERFSLPLIASNGPCYSQPHGRLLYDAFTCLRHHTTLDEAGLLLAANSQRHLKPESTMRELFADLPEAIDNTARIAEQIEFTLHDLGYEFPKYATPDGHDMASYLRHETYRGAHNRYQANYTQAVTDQIEKELALINKLGFNGYFLVIWSLMQYCRENDILAQGRGSAANSIVCYSLGITSAEPISHKLLFERFLSEGRNTWPDIDIDLPSGDKREQVIQEVYRRFAPHGAAMTANVITYRGRSAMREMAKVLALPTDIVERFSDLYVHGDFTHTLELQDHLRQAGLSVEHPRMSALLRLYQSAYGLPRHLGQHSGGMVLCSQGLDTIVPLEPASMPGRVVVQWDKDDCEDLGIIKVDLLGLGMMAVLQETFAMCAARAPERAMELHRIPTDDPKTYDMIQRADTIGVFQIESRAQMATLPRLKPVCFYDIVIATALIRPGPIVGKMVHPYLKRRAIKSLISDAKFDVISPEFEPILERTLGVPLFQEQMLAMAMAIANFSGSEAEELRRALSFHRSHERMEKVLIKLRHAMQSRNVAPDIQERIVNSIKSFAVYGFPESHAIGFAKLAYASAWLRAHRLPELTSALLNHQPMGFYSPSTLVRDARHHGLRVLPVCIVHSELACHAIDDSTIRLGLNQLRGVSRKSAAWLLAERNHRPWQNLDDLLLRCPIPRDERRVLAKSGALNALAGHRRIALWEVEQDRQPDLFSQPHQPLADSNSPLLPMSPAERLEADYSAVSLTVGPHPMSLIRINLRGITRASELRNRHHGQMITIAGMVICRQRPGTAKGHVFISLEDETGISNAFVPSTLFEARRLVINQSRFLRIRGNLQIVDNVISIHALQITTIQDAANVEVISHDFK